jgi:hypothetical protein
MQPDAKNRLKEIGVLLDQGKFEQIRIHNSGIVKPCGIAAQLSTQEKEQDHEKTRSRRPAAEPWTRTQARQGTSNRSRTSSSAPQDICTDLQVTYESGLEELYGAYPGTQVWRQAEGLWLLTESSLLAGVWKKAKFLTWVPFIRTLPVRSWGFWEGKPLLSPKWIGPRHTNYDGSICAFEPKDGTWTVGGSIANLIDLYTLWAIRHLHQEIFGRWPGDQVAHHHHERLTELRGDEYCGCGELGRLYSECCYKKDLSAAKEDSEFTVMLARGEQRAVPREVQDFILGHGEIPQLGELRLSLFKVFADRSPRLRRLLWPFKRVTIFE